MSMTTHRGISLSRFAQGIPHTLRPRVRYKDAGDLIILGCTTIPSNAARHFSDVFVEWYQKARSRVEVLGSYLQSW